MARLYRIISAGAISVEIEVLFCIYNKLMYNVGRQSAIDQLATYRQQAKKKPLVTEILPDPGYARGWRCKLDYDRFFSFGQIILAPIATTGNWRMAMAQSQALYDPHTQPHTVLFGFIGLAANGRDCPMPSGGFGRL
jgi:hypothetical protein